MSQFTPYPIFDLRTGLYLAKEAWLSPSDAFSELENCYLDRGVLKKRRGYLQYGRMVTRDTSKIIITSFATDTGGTKTKITTPFAHGYTTGNTVTIAGCTSTPYNANHIIESASGSTFVIPIAYVAEAAPVYSKTACIAQSYATSEIMGLLPYINAGTTSLLAFNRIRVNKYNTTTSLFEDLTTLRVSYKLGTTALPVAGASIVQGGVSATIEAVSVDNGTWAGGDASGELYISNLTGGNFAAGITTTTVCTLLGAQSNCEFTGDDSQFFWIANWQDIAYFTNGKDQIQTYNNTNLGKLVIDLDVLGGPDNDVSTALLIFVYKSRLMILSPTVDGTAQRQRAMWSEIGLPKQWNAASYTDCPTTDSIVTAGFIGEELVVFFTDSTWKLTYTGDSTVPFKWDKIKSDYGAVATYSAMEFSKEIWTLSNTRIVSCDLFEVKPFDEKIPDMMLSFNQAQVQYCYSSDLTEIRQSWLSYVSTDATDNKPDKVLSINYDEMNWSTHILPVHCLGSYTEISDPTFDGIGLFLGDNEMLLDDIDIALDDITLQAGYPVNLMGCRTGYIYRLNYGSNDSGSTIPFSAISGWWNPYTEEGKRADLGWIDFFVTAQIGGTCDIALFINHQSSAWITRTLNFDATGPEGTKTRYRVYVGCVADFHRIQISHTADNHTVEIHAIVPYFRPAGALYG